jgi:hypothetical protein
MHSCRTYVSNYGDYEYTSDVELNEGAAEYFLEYLKEEGYLKVVGTGNDGEGDQWL